MRLSTAKGDVLRYLRVNKDWELREASAKGFLSFGHLSEVERDVKRITDDTLETLLSAYGISTPDFLRMVADRLDNKLH